MLKDFFLKEKYSERAFKQNLQKNVDFMLIDELNLLGVMKHL